MSAKLNVLYVDDDADLRDLAQMSLQLDPEIRVQAAASGEAALALLDRGESLPDVILLDVMMPEMDGPAVLAAIQARPAYRSIPVIFITARTPSQATAAYRALGVAGIITKPFDPLALAPQVRTLLATRSK
jgi:CheY-like chemotaxis protein